MSAAGPSKPSHISGNVDEEAAIRKSDLSEAGNDGACSLMSGGKSFSSRLENLLDSRSSGDGSHLIWLLVIQYGWMLLL